MLKDLDIPPHRLAALDQRGEAQYDDRLLSAMRAQFGGHAEKAAA